MTAQCYLRYKLNICWSTIIFSSGDAEQRARPQYFALVTGTEGGRKMLGGARLNENETLQQVLVTDAAQVEEVPSHLNDADHTSANDYQYIPQAKL